MSPNNYEKIMEFEEDGGIWINDIERYEEDIRDIAEKDVGSLDGKWIVVGGYFNSDGKLDPSDRLMVYDPETDDLDEFSVGCMGFSKSYSEEVFYRASEDVIPGLMWDEIRDNLQSSGLEKVGELSPGNPLMFIEMDEDLESMKVGGDKHICEIYGSKNGHGKNGIEATIHPYGVDLKILSDYTREIPKLDRVDGLYWTESPEFRI